jgi:hypothetical protein
VVLSGLLNGKRILHCHFDCKKTTNLFPLVGCRRGGQIPGMREIVGRFSDAGMDEVMAQGAQDPQPTAKKEVETSVPQPKGTNFCQWMTRMRISANG